MACYARIRLMSLSICVLLTGCTPDWTVATGSTAAGRIAGPTEPGGAEEWLLPSTVNGYLMRTQLYRPPGGGPFPMALISHGSQQDAMRRKKSPRSDFATLARWFVSRGYVVVLPERPGHGGGGRYLEDQRGCDDADYIGAANGAADSISIAVDYMKRQSFVLPQGIVLAGHSAGAFGSLAYAARDPGGLRAVVNFSGGRGGRHLDKPSNNCAPERLVAAAAFFGSTTRVPTLWIYAENDTYFPPALSRQMARAFDDAGGRAEYHLLPPLPGEGHFAVRSEGWSGILADFLARSR